jgi:hypothetical protein
MKAVFAFLSALIAGVSCMAGQPDSQVRDIGRVISQSLTPGASFDQIEAFVRSMGFVYDFDYHTSRFQARPKEGGRWDDNIAIYIYVDIDGRFVRFEVERVYTSL